MPSALLRIMIRPRPPGSASESVCGLGFGWNASGSKAMPMSLTDNSASLAPGLRRRRNCRCTGEDRAVGPPCAMMFESVSFRHRSSRLVCSADTPRSRQILSSQAEARRNSFGSALTDNASTESTAGLITSNSGESCLLRLGGVGVHRDQGVDASGAENLGGLGVIPDEQHQTSTTLLLGFGVGDERSDAY